MSLTKNLSPELRRKLLIALFAIGFVIALGTIGFYYFEGLSFSDSLYLTTTTVTTVGYGDIVPRTPAGRHFTIVFILFGVGAVLYALSVLAQAFVQKEVIGLLGIRRRSREMEKLSNHYIVCGAGRVGRRIIQVLQKQGLHYVVIDLNPDKLDRVATSEKGFKLKGDATMEDTLTNAGVARSSGLATCLSDDAKNVYVSLIARDLNKTLHIVSRAVEEQAEPKLIRAGASRVVSPIIIGSQSMARALVTPAIADFMDSIVAENLDLVFEEITVAPSSDYVGKTLADSDLRNEMDILIVAIRRNDGDMIFNPVGQTVIHERDLLIVVGKADCVQKLQNKM
ncbi:MAG: potassium channel family protein [Pyrinomonadaceae bacterium]